MNRAPNPERASPEKTQGGGRGREQALQAEGGVDATPLSGDAFGVFKTQEKCPCGQSADEAGSR